MLAAGEEFLNETTTRCSGWPLNEVYRRAADDGMLFSVETDAMNNSVYLDPWERPCDTYEKIVAGQHHYCTIDFNQVLRCNGHNMDGRSSLDWADPMTIGGEPTHLEMMRPTKVAFDEVALQKAHNLVYETEQQEADRVAATMAEYPGRYRDVCVGMYHTCAVEETDEIIQQDPMLILNAGNITGTRLRCWGNNYSTFGPPNSGWAIDVGGIEAMIAMNKDRRGGIQRVMCGRRFVCGLQATEATVPLSTGPRTDTDLNGPRPGYMGGDNWYVFCSGIVETRRRIRRALPTECGRPR